MRLLAVLLSALLFACSGEAPLEVPAGCQPLAAELDCVLPYPSDFFVKDTPDGRRVVFEGAAKRRSDEGASADLGEVRPIAGFSRIPLIVATFAAPIASDGLVRIDDDPNDALDPSKSATIIVDATTLERVPHYADIDPLEGDGARNALVLHPLVRLEDGRRYVVSVAGLVDTAGAPIVASSGFARVRDGGEVVGLERYEADVFAVIEGVGIARKDLQLAWDFTTGRHADATRDMFAGRARMRAAVAAKPPTIVVDEVIEDPEDAGKALVWREVHGHIVVPLLVDSPDRGAMLLRDASGDVRIEGETDLPFIALVPDALRDTSTPGRTIGYGHGFFGERREVLHGAPQRLAESLSAVMFAIDWQGMSMRDVTEIVEQLVGAPSHAMDFTDRVHQGVLNWIAMTAALRGGMAELPAFRRTDGTAVFDPTQLSFIGISQGHILGGVMTAVNTDFDRIALNVGGAGLTHMMARSKPFEPFLELLALAMTDPLERLTFVATMQSRLDVIDPATYAEHLVMSPLEGASQRKLLLQIGVADTSVPDVTGYFHARLANAKLLRPSAVDVFGLEDFTDGDAALTVFDFGADRSFMATPKAPVSKNEVHDGVRGLPAAIRQLDALFAPDGGIVRACDGACDPE